jgi:hypothetical protein
MDHAVAIHTTPQGQAFARTVQAQTISIETFVALTLQLRVAADLGRPSTHTAWWLAQPRAPYPALGR